MLNEFDILKKHIFDNIELCQKNKTPKFIGFLSEEEQALAKGCLSKNINYSFYSGYTGGERAMLGIFANESDIDFKKFPIKAVSFSLDKTKDITHRDILGSVMGLGIKRSAIGDIIINKTENKVYIILVLSVFNMVISELKYIKRNRITLNEENLADIPEKTDNFEELRFTVSSLRIDSVVSAICGCSRSASLEFIKSGLVFINGIEVNKCTKSVFDNDKITVRKKGKFIVKSTNGYTKKGKVILICLKYI